MFSKLLRHITEGKLYQALELFEVNGEAYFALLVLESKKGELNVVSEHLERDKEGLFRLLDTKKPLFITFNNSKVLKKQIDKSDPGQLEALVIHAFPNLELDSFLYQLYQGKGQSFVSICKKEYVNAYLKEFTDKGIKPMQIALGISNLEFLEGCTDGVLVGSNFQIAVGPTSFEGLQHLSVHEPAEINLQGIVLHTFSLLGFFHILTFLKNEVKASNLGPTNTNLKNEFKNARWFDFGVKFGLLFFLVVLLGNFLVFNYYHEENLKIQEGIASTRDHNKVFEELESRIAQKENRLQRILNSKNSNTSFVLDELGKSVPDNIFLSDVQFQPLAFPLRNDKPIALTENGLLVSGVTNDRDQFTVWSEHLETQKWVAKIEIMDYEYISRTSANFTLKILLDEVQH